MPVSKDSVVCLSKKLSGQLGGINPLCVVSRVTSAIHLIDPASAQSKYELFRSISCSVLDYKSLFLAVTDITSQIYWREPFTAVCNPKSLIEFIVMDVEPILDKDRKYFPGQGTISKKVIIICDYEACRFPSTEKMCPLACSSRHLGSESFGFGSNGEYNSYEITSRTYIEAGRLGSRVSNSTKVGQKKIQAC